MTLKHFLTHSDNIAKSSYIWNTAAGLLNAFQSMFILIVLSRTNTLSDAGVFSLAYATACLLLPIANYGLRNYQVTDITGKFTFNQYLSMRVTTGSMMVLVLVLYLGYGYFILSFSAYKMGVIAIWGLLKLLEAVEDVFYGFYQKEQRLDVAAKSQALRMVITTLSMAILLVCTSDLLLSSALAFVISIVSITCLLKTTSPMFLAEPYAFTTSAIKPLFGQGFGLFCSAFLALYIANAPKYAIDAYLSSETQAIYTYIAMPVFVINLLNIFLYQPILASLGREWVYGVKQKFIKRIVVQFIIIFLLTVCTLVGAYFLGIPVLSWLYSTDLSPYKMELLVLLLGGGFLATAGFLSTVLTVIRHQKDLAWGYVVAAIVTFVASPMVVARFGITGAAFMYTASIALLALTFGVDLVVRIAIDQGNGR